jgi:hypothetical protein
MVNRQHKKLKISNYSFSLHIVPILTKRKLFGQTNYNSPDVFPLDTAFDYFRIMFSRVHVRACTGTYLVHETTKIDQTSTCSIHAFINLIAQFKNDLHIMQFTSEKTYEIIYILSSHDQSHKQNGWPNMK